MQVGNRVGNVSTQPVIAQQQLLQVVKLSYSLGDRTLVDDDDDDNDMYDLLR